MQQSKFHIHSKSRRMNISRKFRCHGQSYSFQPNCKHCCFLRCCRKKNTPCYQLSQQNCLNQAKSQLHWNVFAPVLDSCPFQGDIIVSWDHGTIDPTPNEKNLQIPRWMQLSITDQHCPLFPKINLSHRDKQEKGFTQHWTTICNCFRSPDTNPMPFAFSCKIHES